MFSHEDLMRYLNNFKEEQREVIYKAILDSDMLEKALSSQEGKLVLNNAIEVIASNVISIVMTCSDKAPDEAAKEIYPKCLEINLAHKLMSNWAKIFVTGLKHKTKIGEKNA